jgi:hypothetical protein
MRISGLVGKAGRRRRNWGAEAVEFALIRAANRCRAIIETHFPVGRLRRSSLNISRWCRRLPQSHDEPQDIQEHLPRHGDLERDVAAVELWANRVGSEGTA